MIGARKPAVLNNAGRCGKQASHHISMNMRASEREIVITWAPQRRLIASDGWHDVVGEGSKLIALPCLQYRSS